MSTTAATILCSYLDKMPQVNETSFLGNVPQWFSDIYLPGGIPYFPKPQPEKRNDAIIDDDGEPVITDEWEQWRIEHDQWYIFYRLKVFRQWLFFLEDFCNRDAIVGPFGFGDCDPSSFPIDQPYLDGRK